MAERNYYMVRAMSSNWDDFKVFFDNSVVAVGWSEVNFTEYPEVKELRDAVVNTYYSDGKVVPQALSKKLNQVERFTNIKEGDYIIVPYYSYIALAEASANHSYSKDAKPRDLANQLEVKYRHNKKGDILAIPRENLTEGLQRRLRVRGNTVADLYDFRNEIEEIFDQGETYSYSNRVNKARENETEKFIDNLLKNIQSGDTNLKAGGIGLENLIKELLECEGYKARILPKNSYETGTDADIEATRSDDFVDLENYYIQVKHHTGVSGKEGIEQLIKVQEQMGEASKNYTWIFITSADSISQEAQDLSEDKNIVVKDGKDLAKMIVNNLDKLSEATKQTLGICEVPFLVSSK